MNRRSQCVALAGLPRQTSENGRSLLPQSRPVFDVFPVVGGELTALLAASHGSQKARSINEKLHFWKPSRNLSGISSAIVHTVGRELVSNFDNRVSSIFMKLLRQYQALSVVSKDRCPGFERCVRNTGSVRR